MAQSLQIDTLAFSKRLKEAGADEKLAEAIVEGISKVDTSDLATKTNITELRSVVKNDITQLRAEVKNVENFLRGEIAEVKVDLKTEFAALYKHLWLMGIGIVALVTALDKLL
ncbi:conserved hypothetical protein [Rhodobacteraceae bacterium KLH11]|nr:conserved hypothetical protein [Rhodobacteraceae bacterium KLH11]